MESSELSEQTPTAEDLSERSYESNSRSRSSSIHSSSSNPSDSSFRPYQGFEELAAKPEEDAHHATVLHSLPACNNDYDDYLDNTPVALDKPKDLLLARPAVYSDPTARSNNSSRETGGNLVRTSSSVGSSSSNLSGSHKDALHNFYREIREIRQKALERHQSVAVAAAVGKDSLDLMKSYGLPLKDLGELRSRIAIDRLRTGSFHGGEATTLEAEELKQSLQQLQSRVPALSQSAPSGVESTSLAFERLRQSHPLFQAAAAAAAVASESAGQTSVAAPFAAHHASSLHQPQQQQAFTQLQLQQQRQVQQQQQQQHNHHHHHHHHQQQQAKSFTIDAILGLRGGSQREKQQSQQQRQQSYRKQQGQASNGPDEEQSSSSVQDGGGNASSSSASGPGKLKRVRTIFTAEQLERLEGEFARQQYMVGPERLYLAHALRLTEAQVKVWFQNRRIKWRKVNHEQQSQRLHELGQTAIASAAATEPDDCSNENSPDW